MSELGGKEPRPSVAIGDGHLRQRLGAVPDSSLAALDAADIGITVLDATERYVDATDTALRILGLERAELIGRTLGELTEPQDYAREHTLVVEVLAGIRPRYRVEKWRVQPDGSRRLFQVDVTLSTDPETGEPRVVRIVRDVSKQFADRNEARVLFPVLERSADFYLVLDEEHRIKVASASLLALLETEMVDLIGRTDVEVLAEQRARVVLDPSSGSADDLARVWHRLLTDREPARYQVTLPGLDGTVRTFALRSENLVDDPVVGGILTTAQEVTELRAAESRTLRSLRQAIGALSRAAEARDPYTAGHQSRVQDLVLALADELAVPADERSWLGLGALVHDIGKLGCPAELLTLARRLDETEMAVLRRHAEIGEAIMAQVDFPYPVADVVGQHHERWDGSGYPRGLRGEDIVLGARIIAVADTVDAMATHRPYRPALGIDAALEEIQAGAGVRFDPAVADACLTVFASGYELPVGTDADLVLDPVFIPPTP